SFDNIASNILANGNADFTGNKFNNLSATDGNTIVYQAYRWNSTCDSSCEKYEWYNIPSHTSVESLIKKYRGGYSGGAYYIAQPEQITESTEGQTYRAVIQAGGNVTANFADNISNTSTTANAGKVSNTITAPSLNTLSHQSIGGSVQKQGLTGGAAVAVNSPEWKDQLQGALQQINGGGALEKSAGDTSLANISTSKAGKANLGSVGGLANAGVTAASAGNIAGGALANTPSKPVDTSAYPLPSGNNGFFVVSDNPKSPYLINVNPKLDGLGELDPALFGDLNKLLGVQPGAAPRETRTSFTNEKQFLGSSYMLGRLNLNPEYDYRFLGDAAFDTRYVSNTLLNQTGNRYLNGVGSDLQQMQYLMDSAAAQQKSLGLQFGVALTRDQIASLDKSILWWESATVNGETVMIPKLYLSPKDVTVNNGSVIAGNNVSLKGGDITSSGSTLLARQDLKLDSQNSISNLSDGLMKAGGSLNLSAIGDINNISSAISGKTVALESTDGSINNITLAEQTSIDARNKHSSVMLKDTTLGSRATISAQDSLALQAGKNITLTGANLASGGDLLMNAWGDIAVNANQVNDAYGQSGFRNNTNTSRSSVTYQGSSISAGGNLGIKAGDNLRVAASDIKAGGNAALAAGGDLSLDALQTSNNSRNGKRETHSTGLDRTTVSAGDNLTLSAGRDVNAHAAALAAEKNIGIQAGRDVNLEAEATTAGDSYRSKKKTTINESVRQQGTELASGGNTVIVAGRDMNAEAAQATAKGDIGVTAGRDINLATATESDYRYKEKTTVKKGFLKKTTTHTVSEQSATREAGTLLSGDNVTLKAGEDVLVKGSAVAGDGNVALSAGKNVDIVAATNTDANWQLKEKKKSGLMGSGGIGFTIGSSKTRHELKEKGTTQSQSVSTVGSTGGDVSITAGEQARVSGADLVAGKNLTLTGDSVIIEPGHDKRTRTETFEQKSSGLTVALSGAVGDAVNSAVTTAMAAKEQSDSRLAGLQATKAVLSGVQANQASRLAEASHDKSGGIAVSVSLTAQKSSSKQQQETSLANGSTLSATNNLAVVATGKGDSANSGDILIGGSKLKAGADATLSAANNLLLTGAANTEKTTGKNSSSGGGIGLSFGLNQGSAGISIFANANASKGKEKGNGTTWSETTVDSGGTATLTSGRDATLNGAQVNGEKVIADVGRNLTIASQQDSNRYNSKQTNVNAGGSFTFGSMTGSGYLGVTQDKMRSTFDSVAEQSGVFAGKGGFDVSVGNHTQLNGAVIGSTAAADKNRLETGTLGFTDIGNKADYKVSHKGGTIGVGTGSGSLIGLGSSALSAVSGAMLSGLGNSGHASGTTQSAVSEGTIVIRDKTGQQQDMASLSRDVANANDAISPIFNKEKEQKRLQIAQMTGDIAGQMTSMVMTEGNISALKAARAVPGNANLSAEELKQTRAYQDAFRDYGTGGKYQQIAQSASAAIAGLANGDFSGAVAGAAAPFIATFVKKHTDEDSAQRILAHALAGAVIAKAQGKDALAGAAGASTGEMTAKLALDLYGKKPEQLGEDERQLVSALSSVAAGLAGAAVSDNTASVQTAAQAGKNAVENNFLKNNEPETFAKKLADCGNDGGCRADVMKEMVETSNKNIDEFSDCMKAGNKACVDNQLNDIANATGFDALTAEIGTDAVNAYKDGMGVEAFNNAIDCMGMGWEACSNKKGWKLVESGSGVLIIAGGQTIGGKLAEAIAGSKGPTANGYKISNGADKAISKADLEHPIVQSRINVQNGNAREGWEHVVKRHFSGKENASQFTLSQTEVKSILQSSDVAKIPISNTHISINKATGQQETLYERVIIFDKNIGIDKFSGGKPTNTMTILTDKKGNLITATPGRM
ncbi:hemagglutinin repeat-containing protein, partial [Cronobacter muytjensii]|nr:hemagglutinin repeat-containing protein [Cronobacter muytjensii]